ncbi:MAG: YceI family protein [Verrucomicrobiota bacterium]
MKALLCLLALIPLAAAAEPQCLVLDRQNSRVEIDVKATVDSFTGRLEDYTPVILLDERGDVTSATVSFKFIDVKTGKAERDEQMHVWQETDRHPDGVFKLESLTPAADGGGLRASGTLALHGLVREIDFPVSITRDGSLMAVDGVARLDTRDFGLPIIRKFLLLKVDPEVVVRFHLQGVPKASDSPNNPVHVP